MNRREFLGASAAALMVAADSKPAGKMTFGFSLYGMKSLPLDEALKACSMIGYDTVELALMPGYHADPAKLSKDDRKRLRDRLAESKLGLPALMENLPLDVDATKHAAQLERLKAACELARDLGGDKPPIIETILGGKPGQWDDLKETFAKRLGDWARIAADARVNICIKPHRMGAMNLPEQALWLLKQVDSPSVRAAYDWSHYEGRGLKLKKTVQALAPVSSFVHIKDTIFSGDKATFVLPGDGATDYVELLSALRDAGYAGDICVEVSGMVSSKKDYEPVAAAKQCYEKLAPAFAKAKVR